MASAPADSAPPLPQVAAVLAAFLSPSVSPDERRAREAELVALRDRPDAWRWALETLFTPTSSPILDGGVDEIGAAAPLQWLLCSAVESALLRRWHVLPDADRRFLSSAVSACLVPPARGLTPLAISKLAKALADVAKREWPERDPDFFNRLLAVAESNRFGPSALAALRVVAVACEELAGEAADVAAPSVDSHRADALAAHVLARAPEVARRIIVQTLPDVRLDDPASRAPLREDERRSRLDRRAAALRAAVAVVAASGSSAAALEAVGADGLRWIFGCVREGVRDAASHAGVLAEDEDDGPASRASLDAALELLVELLGKARAGPSVAPLLALAAEFFAETCDAFAAPAADSDSMGDSGDDRSADGDENPSLADAATSFFRALASILAAQLPRLEPLGVVPRLLESLLRATASATDPRAFLAACGAWRETLARVVAERERVEDAGEDFDASPVRARYAGGVAHLVELILRRCLHAGGRVPGAAAGPGPYLSELDPTPGSGFGAVDGADEGERDDDARDRRGDWDDDDPFGLRALSDDDDDASGFDGSDPFDARDSERDAFRAGCVALAGAAADACPAATSSRVLPAFRAALERYGAAASGECLTTRGAGAGAGAEAATAALEATEDAATALEVMARCAGGMAAGGRGGVGGAEGSSAAVDAVTALLDAAPELARVATIHARTVANTAPITAASARRIPRAAYAAVGACAPWAARLAEASSSSSSGFLAAALRASLEPLRRPDEYSDATIAAASGAIAAALNASRPSPAELLSSSETAEAARILPAAATARRGVASVAASECLGALGAAMLRRAPGGASDDADAQLWAPRVAAFETFAAATTDAAKSAAARGDWRVFADATRATAALTVAAADAPAAPRRAAVAATAGALLPIIAELLARAEDAGMFRGGDVRGGDVRGAADADAYAFAFAPAADACAFFVETTIRRAAAGDVDADLLLAVAARLLRGDASNARRAPRLVSLAAAILTRPSSAVASALAPALEITAGRWEGAAEGAAEGAVSPAAAAPASAASAAASSAAIAPEFRAPLAAVHLATLRLRWPAFKAAMRDASPAPGTRAAILSATPRMALERAGGVLTGAIPATPAAFRGVVVEVLRCERAGILRAECLATLNLREAFAGAAVGALVARRHEGAAAELRELTHALASADPDAFFNRVAPAAAAEARHLTDEQRAAILALVPRTCADEPSLGRALERFARDAKLYARVNRTALLE